MKAKHVIFARTSRAGGLPDAETRESNPRRSPTSGRLLLLCVASSMAMTVAMASGADPQLEDLDARLSRQLAERVEAKTAELVAAALEAQMEKLTSRADRERRLAAAAADTGRMTCELAPDKKLTCVVVARPPAKPEVHELAAVSAPTDVPR